MRWLGIGIRGGGCEGAEDAGREGAEWLTAGKPDAWTVVCWNPRGWYYDAHPVGAVEFLVGWLSGRISTSVFPDATEFAESAESAEEG
ncbi:hypothetical protein N7U49_32180 [Streptomyces sp. AD2-2]|nr:hypothetical protein N7U49_32180 [Streptomyces sp. AD2-2]